MAAVAPAASPAPPALTPPPGNPRFPLFDGLRAIAALSIVVTHASGLTTFGAVNDVLGPFTARLNAGVAVFFVISGFLLWRPFVAARLDGRGAPSARRFWWRRALRILPAYWAALIVLSIWPGLNGFPHGDWWKYALLMQNLWGDTIQFGIGPAWSLCIEAEFYLLLPLAALGVARLLAGRSRREQVRLELIGIGVLALLSLAARTYEHSQHPGSMFGYTVFGSYLWFAPGMAFAVLSAGWSGPDALPRPAWARVLGRRTWLAWAGALAVLVLLTQIGLPRDLSFRYSERTWFGEHVLYMCFAALLVLPAVVAEDRPGLVPSILGSRVAAWLGLVSYGVFLYHLPILPELLSVQDWSPSGQFFVYTGVSCAVAIGCGAASYYLVERPLLRFK